MSDVEDGENVNGARGNGGVLTNLPRARPQRASARRLAERNGASARNGTRKAAARRTTRPAASAAAEPTEPPAKRAVKAVGESAASSTAKVSRGKRTASARASERPPRRATTPRRAQAKRSRPAPVEDPAPRQGFECDSETPHGSVQPPGGVELVASAAELVGELAKAGVTTGERLLKDVLSRLPL